MKYVHAKKPKYASARIPGAAKLRRKLRHQDSQQLQTFDLAKPTRKTTNAAAHRATTAVQAAEVQSVEPSALTGGSGGTGVIASHGGLNAQWISRQGETRDLADVILALGPTLDRRDYALLDAAIIRGTSIILLAALREETPATTRRRVKLLLRLVLAFEYEFVIRNRRTWPSRTRVVADACILRGLSIRRAAAALRISPDIVRRERRRVMRLIAKIRQREKGVPHAKPLQASKPAPVKPQARATPRTNTRHPPRLIRFPIKK